MRTHRKRLLGAGVCRTGGSVLKKEMPQVLIIERVGREDISIKGKRATCVFESGNIQ